MPNDVQCLVASVKKKCCTEYNMMRKITVSNRKVAAIQKAVIENNSSRKKWNWLRDSAKCLIERQHHSAISCLLACKRALLQGFFLANTGTYRNVTAEIINMTIKNSKVKILASNYFVY